MEAESNPALFISSTHMSHLSLSFLVLLGYNVFYYRLMYAYVCVCNILIVFKGK